MLPVLCSRSDGLSLKGVVFCASILLLGCLPPCFSSCSSRLHMIANWIEWHALSRCACISSEPRLRPRFYRCHLQMIDSFSLVHHGPTFPTLDYTPFSISSQPKRSSGSTLLTLLPFGKSTKLDTCLKVEYSPVLKFCPFRAVSAS